jgi:hypothetical protein
VVEKVMEDLLELVEASVLSENPILLGALRLHNFADVHH